jgi:dTDP-4-dehydrorhamnose reductase
VGLWLAGPPGGPGASWLRADLAAADGARLALDSARPGCIVHCAALTDVDWCERHPEEARRFHVDLTADLAQWADAHGARLIYVSTDSVFDGATGGYDESAAPAPINVYARTKLAGEQAAARARRHLIARTNFYGWSPPGKKRLCEWALERLRRGDPVPGFADVFFAPLAAPELAGMLARLASSEASGIVHLCAADGASKYDFLCMLAQGLGYPAHAVQRTSVEGVTFAAPRPRDTTLRTCRASELGLEPSPSVAQGLIRFLAAGVPAKDLS